jgi:4-amino-4-deoxy-L-arabinose transferase-like glycosyltransferase
MIRSKNILLLFILILAFVLRVYKLTSVPPSLNWDEVAAGYNAYTIAHWGKDEWGEKFPLVFTSFRDDKHPVHIYLTSAFVRIFGPSDFTARFPSALVGVLAVLVMFYLGKNLFDNQWVGYFSALFLAVSPYHIHYSRGLWEVNFALFFFLLGFLFFVLGVKKHPRLFYASYFSFGLSLISYHSAKVVVPPMVLLLTILYFAKSRKSKHFLLGFLLFTGFVLLVVLNKRLLGLARVEQTGFSKEKIQNTVLYRKTGNDYLGLTEVTFDNYKGYFNPQYLFVKGDQNPRGSVKAIGQLYKIDAILILIGLLALVLHPSKASLLLPAWILLAPVPAALSSNTANATRGMFMMGSFQLLSALGAATLVGLVKKEKLKLGLTLTILVLISFETFNYLKYYFTQYSKNEAIEWQYGMKQIVEYVNEHPEYKKVYMDSIRQQPYIFFLFYSKQALPEFLETVKYEQTKAKSYNTVFSYGRYQFGGWDWIESYPTYGNLYILEPYKYSGLKHIQDFEVVKLIKYPDGSEAFYLVTGYK